jgi:hypothetical protein
METKQSIGSLEKCPHRADEGCFHHITLQHLGAEDCYQPCEDGFPSVCPLPEDEQEPE